MIIDICLPTYNGEKFIGAFLESLEKQDYKNWRLTVRDDGSSDDTVEIILRFMERFPGRVLFVTDDIGNLGTKGNLNIILNEVVKYDELAYVMLADQDDIWLPEKISVLLESIVRMEENSNKGCPILIHSDLAIINEKDSIIASSYWQHQKLKPANTLLINKLLVQNGIVGCATIFNKQLLQFALPIPKNAIMHDWWLGLIASSLGKIGYIDKATVMYRQHEANQIGVTKLRHSINKILTRNIIGMLKCLVNSYYEQAQALYVQLNKIPDSPQIEILEEFLSLKEYGYFKKRWKIFRLKILKTGCIRNIGLILGL